MCVQCAYTYIKYSMKSASIKKEKWIVLSQSGIDTKNLVTESITESFKWFYIFS